MVGKLLGDRPQGAWMGIMFALGAIARIAGPFWAVTGYAWFGSFAVFGSSGALFAAALLATRVLWAVLVPDDDDEVAPAPADFVGTKREYGLASPAHHISPRLRSQEAEPRLYAGSPNITPRSFSLTPALNRQTKPALMVGVPAEIVAKAAMAAYRPGPHLGLPAAHLGLHWEGATRESNALLDEDAWVVF